MGGMKEQVTTINKNKGRYTISEKFLGPVKDSFEIFLSLNQVQPKKDMKIPRAMFAVCTGEKFIYVCGGINKEKEEITDCEFYDVA
mmetsp:Transcript_14005/g.13610  ORF Transcript_14005/g.13610 Transcript_14005/m.13610 type:complete len:86 (-) Transcript_14005:548-805(-)